MSTTPTPTTRTVIVKQGDKVIIPKNASMVSVATAGTITLSSTCGSITPNDTFECYSMSFGTDTLGSGSTYGSFQDQETRILGFRIGATEYRFATGDIIDLQDYSSSADRNFISNILIAEKLTELLPKNIALELSFFKAQEAGGAMTQRLAMMIPTKVGEEMFLIIDDQQIGTGDTASVPDSRSEHYIKAVQCKMSGKCCSSGIIQ